MWIKLRVKLTLHLYGIGYSLSINNGHNVEYFQKNYWQKGEELTSLPKKHIIILLNI